MHLQIEVFFVVNKDHEFARTARNEFCLPLNRLGKNLELLSVFIVQPEHFRLKPFDLCLPSLTFLSLVFKSSFQVFVCDSLLLCFFVLDCSMRVGFHSATTGFANSLAIIDVALQKFFAVCCEVETTFFMAVFLAFRVAHGVVVRDCFTCCYLFKLFRLLHALLQRFTLLGIAFRFLLCFFEFSFLLEDVVKFVLGLHHLDLSLVLGSVKSLELFCKDLIPHLQLDEERFQLFG